MKLSFNFNLFSTLNEHNGQFFFPFLPLTTQTMYALDAGAVDVYSWKKHIFLATAVVLICKVLFMSQ